MAWHADHLLPVNFGVPLESEVKSRVPEAFDNVAYFGVVGFPCEVRSLNMTVRYDYSSIADQGYLKGPPNMEDETRRM